MRRAIWGAVAFVCVGLVVAGPARAERIALVIGNSGYLHGDAHPTAANDAAAVATALRNLGFDRVDEVIDARFNMLGNSFLRFARRAARADVAVIYVAGYGATIDGENMLLPITARLQSTDTVSKEAVSLDAAIDAASGAIAERIVIVDAARPHTYGASLAAATPGLAARPGPEGDDVVIVYAADGVVDAPSADGSPLARALIQTLAIDEPIAAEVIGGLEEAAAEISGGAMSVVAFGADDMALVRMDGEPLALATASTTTATVQSLGGAIIVDASGAGDFATIQEAINIAEPGATIKVRPGRYLESLNNFKPLNLIGDGDRSEIVIEAAHRDVLRWAAPSGTISGLTLIQSEVEPSGKNWAAVYMDGTAVLENCDLTSASGAVVQVYGAEATPTLVGNIIRDGAQAGVALRENAGGRYEGNQITGNTLSGFEVLEGGDPVVVGNAIVNNGAHGVFVTQGGLGAFSNNTIEANEGDGIVVSNRGELTAERNTVTGNARFGVRVDAGGGGAFVENNLSGNAGGAWEIDADSRAVKRIDNAE